MRLSFILSLMPLAGFVAALHVTEPEKGEDVKSSDSLTVKWTSVNTDAKSFDLYLVNNAVYPPLSKKLATDVKTSDGSYTIDSLSGVNAGQGFQINLQSNDPMNTGILAQSEQFNVTGSSQSTTTTTSSSSSSSASSSTTSTGTTTSTGSTSGTTTTLITSTTSTGTATGSKTTAGASGVSGSASSTGASASGTSTGTTTPAPNGAAALMAHPVAAAAGLLAGALVLSL